MPEKKVGKFVELPPALVAAVQELCEAQGTTFTFELCDALRRHLACPPVRAPEPLPPETREPLAPAEKPKARRGRPKK